MYCRKRFLALKTWANFEVIQRNGWTKSRRRNDTKPRLRCSSSLGGFIALVVDQGCESWACRTGRLLKCEKFKEPAPFLAVGGGTTTAALLARTQNDRTLLKTMRPRKGWTTNWRIAGERWRSINSDQARLFVLGVKFLSNP